MRLLFNRGCAVRFMVAVALSTPTLVSCAREDAAGRVTFISAARINIAWDTDAISAVLGNGAAENAVVAFTSTAELRDVSITATSAVAPFMDISPAHLDTVLPGVPCSVTIRFKVPPDAAAGTRGGTIRLSSGNRKYARPLQARIVVDFGGAAIPPTTRVVTQATWDELQYAAPDYSLIEFLTVPEELIFVQAGDVIVSGVTEQTPFGLIRKVVSVGSDADTPLSLICADATLADAFASASIALADVLTPDDAAEGQDPIESGGGYSFFVRYAGVLHDGDGDPGTAGDQVTIAGTIGFDGAYSLALDVAASAVQSASFANETSHVLDLTLDAQSGIAPLAKNVDLWSRQLEPRTVWAGYVPVVIVPVLTVRADVGGDVAAPSHAAMAESASMTAGATYAAGAWQPISESAVAGIEGTASAAPGCNVKVRVGPRLDLLVYGVPGPHAQTDGCLRTAAGGAADPWWRLYGGIEADAGIRTEALDGALAGALFPAAVQDERLLAEGGAVTPEEDGAIAGVVRDAATGDALADVRAVAMLADALVAEDLTDALGGYALTVPAGDGYTVAFSKEGYLAATFVDVSVAAEQTTALDVELQAEETPAGTIAGIVRDADTGDPLSDVHAVATLAGSLVAEGITDALGSYALAVPAAGGYTVVFSKEGYVAATVADVSVAAEQTTALDVDLQADHTETGTIAGVVRDAATRVPLAGVHAVALPAGSLDPAAQTDTIADGSFALIVPPAGGYTVIFTKEGYLPATYFEISAAANQTTYIEAVLQIDATHAGIGSIGGTIINALTGEGVPGLAVELREGLNATSGTVVATAPLPTDGAGHYSITDLPAGNYTACAYGDGYHSTFFSVVCLGGLMIDNQDGTITPILPPGQTRLVLTWGEVPADLDSHLTGPLPDGTRFWLFYYYLYHPNPWALYVSLDHDDTTSFGPETTTILLQIDGVYRFTVHDFTNGNATAQSPSFALSNSGALVRVYRDEGLVAKFAVPPNRSGTLWAVFDLSGDAITPLNIMTYDPAVIHP